jgi:uncharacterized protein (TIGR00251 family)
MHADKPVIFNVRVQPRAKRNTVIAGENTIKIYVTAPAEDGRANAAVVDLIAEWLRVKRRQVNILSGPTSRNKVIAVTGIASKDLARVIKST